MSAPKPAALSTLAAAGFVLLLTLPSAAPIFPLWRNDDDPDSILNEKALKAGFRTFAYIAETKDQQRAQTESENVENGVGGEAAESQSNDGRDAEVKEDVGGGGEEDEQAAADEDSRDRGTDAKREKRKKKKSGRKKTGRKKKNSG